MERFLEGFGVVIGMFWAGLWIGALLSVLRQDERD